MPLFSSFKSKMRRESTSSVSSEAAQKANLNNGGRNQNKEASDVLGDSPSFNHGGSTNNNSTVARTRSPSETGSLKSKGSQSMLRMLGGNRSPSSSSVSSTSASISKGKSNKRNSFGLSSSVDNLGRTSTAGGGGAGATSSPPVSNSAAAANSLRSFNTSTGQNGNGNGVGSLPTLATTTAPGALLHAFNNPEAPSPTTNASVPAGGNAPRPSDLFAGRAAEWGSIGGVGKEAPAPKAEDLQSFLKARRQWVPTFVTEEAPAETEKTQRLEDVTFASSEPTSAGVMSLKDLDASHQRKKQLLGELPLGSSGTGLLESPIASTSASASTSGAKPKSKSPSSPPPSGARPAFNSSPSGDQSSPGSEKPGRSTSFRNSIFPSSKSQKSGIKDQATPKASSKSPQLSGKEAAVAGVGAGTALGAGVAAAVGVTAADASDLPRASKGSASTETTVQQAEDTPISSTTDPSSGAADVLISQPTTAPTSAEPSTIRESIDSSAQGFQTPEGGSTRTSLAAGEESQQEAGDETINSESIAGAGETANTTDTNASNLPALDSKDLENGEIVGQKSSQEPPITPTTQTPTATESLSPERPPRPTKSESRSRPPSPDPQLKSDDTLQGQAGSTN